jgi:hypothetical protein
MASLHASLGNYSPPPDSNFTSIFVTTISQKIQVYCQQAAKLGSSVVQLFAVFTVDAELLARSQYSEGPAKGHLDTGFSWFPVSVSKC